MLGRHSNYRVPSFDVGKPCRNSDDTDNSPSSIFWTASVHTSQTPPRAHPHCPTSSSTTSHRRLNTSRSSGSRPANSFAVVVAPLRYSTNLPDPSAERELDLQHFQLLTLRYRSGTPMQHHKTKPLFTARCASAQAHRELSWSWGEICIDSGYGLQLSRALFGSIASAFFSALPAGTHIWYKPRHGPWWLGKMVHHVSPGAPSRNSCIVRFLIDPGPIKINLWPPSYTTPRDTMYRSWYFSVIKPGDWLAVCCRTPTYSGKSLLPPLVPPLPAHDAPPYPLLTGFRQTMGS